MTIRFTNPIKERIFILFSIHLNDCALKNRKYCHSLVIIFCNLAFCCIKIKDNK